MKLTKLLIFIILLQSSLIGCQSKLLTVYKIDVQQGNALEAESVDKISLGMTKEQVHYVLGSPIIIDSFHPDRWDYIYLFTPGYGEQERRQLTLFFDRGEIIEIVRNNITGEDLGPIESAEEIIEEVKKEEESKSSEQEIEEQEELEKQAEELESLEKNTNPIN